MRLAVALTVSTLILLAVLVISSFSSRFADTPTWSEVNKLIDQELYKEAKTKTEEILAEASSSGRDREWAQALVYRSVLERALHGYETSLRGLMEADWPSNPKYRALLHLYCATSLLDYLDVYRREIAKREKVVSEAELDLRKWTSGQILSAANRQYYSAWLNRAGFGTDTPEEYRDFVDPGSPRENVRRTMHEFLTYHWIDFLKDKSHWEGKRDDSIYALNAKDLLRGKSGLTSTQELIEDEVHPLEKIVYLLGELNSWCVDNGLRAAALEAELERIGRLKDSSSDIFDIDSTRPVLLEVLGRNEDVPWWSEGMRLLAQMEQENGDLAEAYEVAMEGYRKYPESFGGEGCLAKARGIEAPKFRMQGMTVDGIGSESILINHKNISKMYFEAHRLGLEQYFEEFRFSGNTEKRVKDILASNRSPYSVWEVEVEDLGDYRFHRTFVTPEIFHPGIYLIIASNGPEFLDGPNEVRSTTLLVSKMVILSQSKADQYEVQVVNGENGAPLPGVTVKSYTDRNGSVEVLQETTTDSEGRAVFESVSGFRYPRTVVALEGDDVSVCSPRFYGDYHRSPSGDVTAHIYTDRSIYRPGQDVHFKVVLIGYTGEGNEYRTLEQMDVPVWLKDPNGERVKTLKLTTDEFGTASGSFNIPFGRVLGNYYVRTGYRGSAARIKVEEYKRPTFEVELEDISEEVRLGDDVLVQGKATYYFGQPVAGGNVRYKVTVEPEFRSWYLWRYGSIPRYDSHVASGATELMPDGTFQIPFAASAGSRLPDAQTFSHRFFVQVEVTDEGGETREAKRRYRVGSSSVEASLEIDQGFFEVDVAGRMEVIRTDLNGAPRPGEGRFEIHVLKTPDRTPLPSDLPLGAPSGPLTEGDTTRPRWLGRHWQQDHPLEEYSASRSQSTLVASGRVDHDEDGMGTIFWTPSAAGIYRVTYKTEDSSGFGCETHKDVLVYGTDARWMLPAYIVAENDTARVGGNARLLFGSDVPGQHYELCMYQGDNVLQRRQFISSGSVEEITIPVDESLRGGFAVQVYSIGDYQSLKSSVLIRVPWDNKRLDISVKTFRDRLSPGQEETWEFTVTGPDQTRVAAEVLAYMYDRSLDLFVEHAYPGLAGLYPTYRKVRWRPYADIMERRSLSISSVATPGVPYMTTPELIRFFGFGIGGPGQRAHTIYSYLTSSKPAGEASSITETVGEVVRGDEVQIMLGASAKEAPALPLEVEETLPGEHLIVDANLRTDFSETAFFMPHLRTNNDGEVSLSFTVPQSVTSWNLFLHALTRDLKFAVEKKEAITVKELMVRPYLPRFLREGDRAELKLVINNAGDGSLAGEAAIKVEDPDTGEDLSDMFGIRESKKAWKADKRGSTTLTWKLEAPNRVGEYAFRVTAKSENLSDGELRPLPVLPGRMHLMQSKFAVLADNETRRLEIDDLMNSGWDTTLVHSNLIVTIDAQLFYSVVRALPHLVNCCTDRVDVYSNRFMVCSILSRMYDSNPLLAGMAKESSGRETRLDPWEEDPNRRMALEEIPWLRQARGGYDRCLLDMLDERVVKRTRDNALEDLRDAQYGNGAFPWIRNGPSSPRVTLRVLYDFAKAAEFGADIPDDMVNRAWSYLASEYLHDLEDRMRKGEASPEFIAFLNYVLSCYAEEHFYSNAFSKEQREEMLAYSLERLKELSPYVRGMLALTLNRVGEHEEAKRILAVIMDSSTTDPELGTFWAPEERAWIWYNDTVESHSFILRALLEVSPEDERMDGLALWLLLNKKLNQWKSTRTTAQVIYTLFHYMRSRELLDADQKIEVSIGPDIEETFMFKHDEYIGRTWVVVEGDDISGDVLRGAGVSKEGRGRAFASLTWHYSTEEMPDDARGDFLSVQREYFVRQKMGEEVLLLPITDGQEVKVGDQIEVQLSVRSKHPAEYVHLKDPRAAGLEPEHPISRHRWDLGLWWFEEVRDSGTNFFFERLPQGEYTLKYRLRANMSGRFKAGPATLQCLYAPEFSAFSAGSVLEVN
jgi:hypothetical protein